MRRKKALEVTRGDQLTWDEFFERAFSSEKPPELSKSEVKQLKRLVAGERPWKARS
jgi:hypothetical protein